MNIPIRVRNLVNRFNTRNPFELADYLHIEVLRYPLPNTVRGFFSRVLRQKFIVINVNLPHHLQRQACAHELGHACLHKGWGYYFIMDHTHFMPGKFEREANAFAWCLLFDEAECEFDFAGDADRYVLENGISEIRRGEQ